MLKRFIGLCFIVAVIASARAQAQQATEWSKFTSPEGRFAVSLPGRPVRVDESKLTPAGKVEMHIFTARTEKGVFVVAYADYNFDDAKRELDANRDSFLKGMKATLISETPLKLQGNPGRELSAWRDQLSIRSRMYLVGKRYYQMFVIMPTAFAATGEADKFLTSFELVSGAPAVAK